MALGTIVLLFNVIKTTVSKEKAGRDPWDGRTLEWTMPAPTPEYNFKQLPFVRGLDPFWIEKREGNKEMTARNQWVIFICQIHHFHHLSFL